MKKQGTVLVVDDNVSILSALDILLSRYFEKVITKSSPNSIDIILKEHSIDVILLDMNFSAKINTGNEGLFWLDKIKKKNPDIQVVVFTAYADIDLAVDAIKRGASDFVVKPWDNDKLIAALQNAYNLRRSKREVKQLIEIKNELLGDKRMYWGQSKLMKHLQKTINKVSATDANILITGENGTGKEMLAKEIHLLSQRSNELMITVDMGAITETLFESELFGHVKGAFTDAHADRAGKFEVANGGTLFLDEIANLPYHLQAKLLTAIQSKRIVRVGSNVPIDIDVRLICATNRNLEEMVENGTFREDLFYRINTIQTQLPSLRERKEDIIPLSEMFLREYSDKYNKRIIGIELKAREALLEYAWQGNIRELQHTIEKAVIMCDSSEIDMGALLLKRSKDKSVCDSEATTLEELERRTISSSMLRNEGNMSVVAQELGVTRQTLYNKIKNTDYETLQSI